MRKRTLGPLQQILTTLRRSPRRALVLTVPLAAAAACGGASTPPPASVAARPPLVFAATCARGTAAAQGPKPISLVRAGSTVALATVGPKTYAYVADEDDQAVHVFDVDDKKDVGLTPLAGRPAQLMFLGDGRLVVAIRDTAQVEVA